MISYTATADFRDVMAARFHVSQSRLVPPAQVCWQKDFFIWIDGDFAWPAGTEEGPFTDGVPSIIAPTLGYKPEAFVLPGWELIQKEQLFP